MPRYVRINPIMYTHFLHLFTSNLQSMHGDGKLCCVAHGSTHTGSGSTTKLTDDHSRYTQFIMHYRHAQGVCSTPWKSTKYLLGYGRNAMRSETWLHPIDTLGEWST